MSQERYMTPEMQEVWSKEAKFQRWLDVEITVLEAKEELELIPKGIAAQTKKEAKFTIGEIEKREKEIGHDLMAFVQVVSESLPEKVRPYFHAGLTSYDIEDTALATQLRDSCNLIEKELERVSSIIKEKAKIYKKAVQIGRTHGVHAEPITFGLKLLNWYDEMERHSEKLKLLRRFFEVGKISGAVGTYANIDPRIEGIVCKKLGIFPTQISTQIVSRDHHSHYIFLLASISASLEKFATEIRNLQRTEVREVQEPSRGRQRGSSAMPHKKALPNPISSENISSLSRVIRGYVITGLENQALCWHERSLDNSANERITLPEASTYVHYLLLRFNTTLQGLQVYPEKMLENIELTRGIIFSEEVMLALSEKGMAREDAHSLLQDLTEQAWKNSQQFKEVLLANSEITALLSEEEIDACLDPQRHLKNIDQIFARFGI